MARRNQNTAPENIISSDDEMHEREYIKDSNMIELVSILPCRLQMAIMTKKVKCEESANVCFFSTDELLTYANFYHDFGPLNLAKLYRYCQYLNDAMQKDANDTKTFIHYTCKDPKKILNAAFLIGSYSLIYLRFTVPTVMKALTPILKHANGAKYCDASMNDLNYLSLKDCLSSVLKGMQRNFFNFADFNLKAYEHYECVENGDLNWIIPGKLLAFCGPNARTECTSDSVLLGPEVYVEYFHFHNVTVVVRLNSPNYDAHEFTKVGIQHYDLYFPDGTTPSERLTKQFLKICENARGAVAVHCKAGLGRTGTLIGAFLIKHYQFTAMESIAWLRICRPGSVIGQQQIWLNIKQSQLLQDGELYRQQRHLHMYNPPEKHTRGIYSLLVGAEQNDTPDAKEQCVEPENVQRISQRVDTMCLNDADEQESARVDAASQVVHCKPNRVKKVTKVASRYVRGSRLNGGRTIVTTTNATTTNAIRRGRVYANVPSLAGTQQRPAVETHTSRRKTMVTTRQSVAGRTDATSAPSVRNQRNTTIQTASQGEQLNSIKAARRHLVPTDSIQQKTRCGKVIQSSQSTVASTPERHITSSTAVDADKGGGKSQSRTDAAKNNNPGEGGTAQPVLRLYRNATTFLANPSTITSTADLSARHITPTSTVTCKGDRTTQSTEKCGPVTKTTRKTAASQGTHSQSTSLPTPKAHQFLTKISTTVNQEKEVTYEVSFFLTRIIRSTIFADCSFTSPTTRAKKVKPYETMLKLDIRSTKWTDTFTFDVSIDMADVLSGAQVVANGNANQRSKLLVTADGEKLMPYKQGTNFDVGNYIAAKVTWWVEERNRFTFRVSFDLEALYSFFQLPLYRFDESKSAAGEQLKRQFETVVTATRTDDPRPLFVTFSVPLNMPQMLDDADSFFILLPRDHNGNDASVVKQAEKAQTIASRPEKPQIVPSRTGSTNAETDARPYKRLRVDVSRL